MSENTIKVTIVDDSALARQFIAQALSAAPGIEVLATAADPVIAFDRMRRQWPDVLVVDIEMPRHDGMAFLREVMAERPTAIVICSALAARGTPANREAMTAGALAVITRPRIGLKAFLDTAGGEIVRAVRAAARARVGTGPRVAPATPLLRPKNSADVMLAAGPPLAMPGNGEQIIAIGTSTGGTQALEAVLTRLPATCLGIVIVQHMPERFTAMLAQRLNELCRMEIREAQNGDRVMPGRALIAPGGKHMLLKRSGTQYQVDVADGPLVNRHKPSVDVLFRSVARFAGANALGIIMTGMGDDGARGLKEMHDAGARTIAQDEASCVVFGMPREAIKLGAVDQTMALDQIPGAVTAYCRTGNPVA